MKKIIFFLLLPLTFAFCQQKDYKSDAEEIFQQIKNRDFAAVTARFDTNVSGRIDTTKLRLVWDRLLPVAGPFVKVNDITTEHTDSNDVVIQHLQFVKRKIDFRLVFGQNDKIRAIGFLPGEKRDKYILPPYNKPELIVERKFTLQNGPYNLPGFLTEPNKKGRHPLVILIHGYGPNDKDETVGPMKIFKDIAIGLAAKGISVYRYDKRTRVYPVQTALNRKLTIVDETIEDAIAAFYRLKADSTIDSTRIYFCGHSMGGMLLPRIVSELSKVKGLIYLAPNARPMEDVIYDQTEYVLSLDTSGVDTKPILDSIRSEVTKIKSLKKDGIDTTYIFKYPPIYWVDMNQYNPILTAQGINKPMLFLFGDRDYQIKKVDSDKWQEGMKNTKAQFKFYPSLNHFFITGTGKSTIAEYNKSGNVDITVINDIANWIYGVKKK